MENHQNNQSDVSAVSIGDQLRSFTYPLAEFKSHFLSVVENRVAGPGGTGIPLLDLGLHLRTLISDPDEQTWKTVRLHAAMVYLSRNIGAFADDGLAELAPKGHPANVNTIIIDAMHPYFAVQDMREDVPAVEIVRAAK